MTLPSLKMIHTEEDHSFLIPAPTTLAVGVNEDQGLEKE